MAIMNGFVPPNMSPEQAAIMSQYLPKMPRMPHLMSPQQMAGEPNPDMFLPGNPEPMSPYIPIPDSVATRQPRTRQLPLIPGPLSAQSFIGGPGTPPHMMGVPIMPYGANRQAIKEANQRQIEDYLRDRFGPGYPSPFQKNHNKPIPATKPAEGHIAESDHQSVVGICDENGNEITSIQYDHWGQHTVLSGGSVMPDRMYKGMFYHDRSQNYLTLHRVYDPALGRWLSRDPLGEAAGTNLYAYCGNDPINRWDPLGLSFADSGGGEAGIGPGGSLGSPVDNPVGAKCLSQCASKFPILGPLLVAGGLPIIPVSGKLGGAIQGTSIISSGLRASPLGGVSIPPTWAPTATFPFNQTTTNLGGALGRWAPIVGGVLTAAQYADFMNCLQDCENDNSGSSCQR